MRTARQPSGRAVMYDERRMRVVDSIQSLFFNAFHEAAQQRVKYIVAASKHLSMPVSFMLRIASISVLMPMLLQKLDTWLTYSQPPSIGLPFHNASNLACLAHTTRRRLQPVSHTVSLVTQCQTTAPLAPEGHKPNLYTPLHHPDDPYHHYSLPYHTTEYCPRQIALQPPIHVVHH